MEELSELLDELFHAASMVRPLYISYDKIRKMKGIKGNGGKCG